MNKNNLYAFYGSLRPGHGNFNYRKDEIEVIEDDVTINDIALFHHRNFTGYPHAARKKGATIKVTLCRVSEPDGIHRMELGAGYHYDEVEISGNTYGVYLVNPSDVEDAIPVESGDWTQFKIAEKKN